MNASLCFGGRHSLHAMGAGLEFEQRTRAASDDAADDFLVAAVLAGTLAQYLDAPALGLGVARVHPKQVARKNGGFVAARAGADFQENIALVVRVLWHQQVLQLEFLAQEARSQLRQFLLA